MKQYVEVAFPLPVDATFTYDAPVDSSPIKIGQRVLAPFQRRTLTGYVVDLPAEAGAFELKPIHAVLDETPLLPPELVSLARHVSWAYGVPLGEAIQTIVPPGLARESRRKIQATEKEGLPQWPTEKEWLQRIRRSQGLDWTHAVRRDRKVEKLLRWLEKEGWIQIDTYLRGERAREKTETWVELIDPATDEKKVRGPRQQEIIRLLREQGPTSLRALREIRDDIGRVVRDLEKKGVVRSTDRTDSTIVERDTVFDAAPTVNLTPEQIKVADRLKQAIADKEETSFVLHGITGSGKTEIYLRIASEVLRAGKSVLALVPEIALTPQFVGRFRARFGDGVAVLHSARNESERLTEWRRIQRGEARVVIGARSAVFAPLTNLGLVVVDEEHDHSYKQGEGIPYNARDLAFHRAHEEKAVFLCGSATPSLESYSLTRRNEAELLELPYRVTGHDLPTVEIIDLRGKVNQFGEPGLFSQELREAVTETLERGEQVVLFLNRRGFAPVVLCPSCGVSLRCKNCSVTLTFHEKDRHHLCHYCGDAVTADSPCADCGSEKLIKLGVGTERMEKELGYLFPDARIARMDRDTVGKKGGHGELLRKVARREVDILLGTQMITKGLDMPYVSLVGVLLADQSLHFPDFRAAERTFQLLTQVVGRSGRGDRRGKAIIQTFQPDHYAILAAAEQDYEKFYDREILFREELRYPPYTSLALIELSGTDPDDVRQSAMWLGKQCRETHKGKTEGIDLLGPAPAPIRMIQKRTRYHLLIRSPRGSQAATYSRWLVGEARKALAGRKVTLRLDVDPYQFL